jgi:hypothetical protein
MRQAMRRTAAGLLALALFAGEFALAAPVHAQSEVLGESGRSGQSDAKDAIADAMVLLATQHVLRVSLEGKTRRELSGPFFADYRQSLTLPRQWSDGDSALTNYLGHPIEGAAAGFIWVRHDARAPSTFRMNVDYFTSRLRGMSFAAAYSTQFEVGPLSEASIGNVGRRRDTVGWVDHVVTPVGGLALMIGEDAIDRFVLAKLERRVKSPVIRATARILLNPARATANFAARQPPWQRNDRPLRSQTGRSTVITGNDGRAGGTGVVENRIRCNCPADHAPDEPPG